MRLFISSLSSTGSTGTGIKFSPQISVDVPEKARVGISKLGPSVLEFNGNYYGSGMTSLADSERGFAWKFDPITEIYTWEYAIPNWNSAEEILHRYPSMIIDDHGYIFMAATDPHVSTVKLYRTTVALDISTFMEVSSTGIAGGESSYPSLMLDGNDILIYVRNSGTVNPNRYMPSLWRSEIGVYSWSRLDIMENSDIVNRDIVYNINPNQSYGNEWIYILANRRSGDTGASVSAKYYAQIVFKTKDYNTFYNLDETFSKDIVANGIITEAEGFNYRIRDNGWDNNVGLFNASIVNDVLVSYYYDGVDQFMQWFDGTMHETKIPESVGTIFGGDGGVNSISLIGDYYYITFVQEDGTYAIHKTSIPFDTYEKVLDLGLATEFARGEACFPYNVVDERKSICIGSGVNPYPEGTKPVYYNIVTFE